MEDLKGVNEKVDDADGHHKTHNNNNNNNNNNKRSLEEVSSSSSSTSSASGNKRTLSSRRYSSANKRAASDVDALVNKELNALSMEEREAIYEDIHGVAKPIEETPELIKESLEQFDMEFTRIRNKKAYEKARFLSPKYVKDLRLIFLRARRFQPREAAELMVDYFEKKLELFGPDKLVKVLTWEDLSDDDKECLMMGAFQYLPQKDRSGRIVAFSSSQFPKYRAHENHIRLAWYLTMNVLMNDEEVQKKGIVCVCYNMGSLNLDLNFLRMRGKFFQALPSRMVGVHTCMKDNSLLKLSASIIKRVVGTRIRLHVRSHFGSHTECCYELMGFGIPTDRLPVEEDGTLKLNDFNTFIEEIKHQEALNSLDTASSDVIYSPSDEDVLLGKGKPYQEYQGNVRFYKIIEEQLQTYRDASIRDKRDVSNQVLGQIKANGGRFLERSVDGDSWVVASEDVAREKVCQTFRYQIRRVDDNGLEEDKVGAFWPMSLFK